MNLMQILSDNGGQLSSMRTVMAAVIAIVLIKNIAFNVSALVHGHSPVAFDNTDVAMIMAVITGKVGQSITENKGVK